MAFEAAPATTPESNNIGQMIEDKLIQSLTKNLDHLKLEEEFLRYSSNIRKLPNRVQYINYLKDRRNPYQPKSTNKGQVNLTQREADYIHARKIWSDIVSTAYKMNNERSEEMISLAIKRLHKFSPDNDPKTLYEKCVDFIKNSSVITVSFNAGFLKNNELIDFQLLNMWEKDPRKHKVYYKILREGAELGMFNFLPPDLKHAFAYNKQSRPRYGRLYFYNSTLQSTLTYGKSFLLLKNAIYNALIMPGDSLDARDSFKSSYIPSTIHHPEFILAQCPDATLEGLIIAAKTGSFPQTFNQDKWDPHKGGYVEVLLPAINFSDPNQVEAIYIHPHEVKLDLNSLKSSFRSPGKYYVGDVEIINDGSAAVVKDSFVSAIKNNEVKKVVMDMQSYPSLKNMMVSAHGYPVHIAAMHGSLDVLTSLKNEYDFTMKNVNGLSPAHLAIDKNHSAAFQYIISSIQEKTKKPISEILTELTIDGETLLHRATRTHDNPVIIEFLLEHGASLLEKNKDGLRPDQISNDPSRLHLTTLNQKKQLLACAIRENATPTIMTFYMQNIEWFFLPLTYIGQTALHMVAHKEGNIAPELRGIFLHLAIYSLNYEDFSFLLTRFQEEAHFSLGFINDMVEEEGETLLHAAVKYGRNEIGRLLLEIGASLLTKNKDGQRPDEIQCETGENFLLASKESLAISLKAGNRVEIGKFYQQNKEWFFLTWGEENATVLDIIRQSNAIPPPLLIDLFPLLVEIASHYNQVENLDGIVDFLHNNTGKSPLQILDEKRDGVTPLHIAVRKDSELVMNYLLEKGVSLLATNKNGQRADEIISDSRIKPNILGQRKQDLVDALKNGDTEKVKKFGKENRGWLDLPLEGNNKAADIAFTNCQISLLMILNDMKASNQYANISSSHTLFGGANGDRRRPYDAIVTDQQNDLGSATKNRKY